MLSLKEKLAAMTNQAVTVTAEKVQSTGRVGKVGVNRIPEGMVIRLLPISGEVYPSPQVVSAFNLEYKNLETFEAEKKAFLKSKLNPTNNSLLVEEDIEAHENLSCGFDIIDTAIWPNFPKEAGLRLVYIAAVARYAGKVDLFNSCKYVTENDVVKGNIDGVVVIQGDAKTTVSEQGGNEYTKSGEFLSLICEVYGLDEEAIKAEKFLDLEIKVENVLIQTDKEGKEDKFALWQVPKEVSRGEEKGKSTIITRIGIRPMVLIPVNIDELQTKYPKTIPAVGELAVSEITNNAMEEVFEDQALMEA